MSSWRKYWHSDLRHLVNIVHDLTERGIGLKVLTGQGAVNRHNHHRIQEACLRIYAALAEFERELISERTLAGLASARARSRNGGRPYKMTPRNFRLAMSAMGQKETKGDQLCKELDTEEGGEKLLQKNIV